MSAAAASDSAARPASREPGLSRVYPDRCRCRGRGAERSFRHMVRRRRAVGAGVGQHRALAAGLDQHDAGAVGRRVDADPGVDAAVGQAGHRLAAERVVADPADVRRRDAVAGQPGRDVRCGPTARGRDGGRGVAAAGRPGDHGEHVDHDVADDDDVALG